MVDRTDNLEPHNLSILKYFCHLHFFCELDPAKIAIFSIKRILRYFSFPPFPSFFCDAYFVNCKFDKTCPTDASHWPKAVSLYTVPIHMYPEYISKATHETQTSWHNCRNLSMPTLPLQVN